MTDNSSRGELWTIDLGITPYAEALELQRAVAAMRISGDIPEDVLLLVEHPPVVTLGRASKAAHLVSSPEFLASRGVEVFEVERGGDVTFHGPGQLVGYPIFDLKRHKQDLHWYLRQVEEALIVAVAKLGVIAERRARYTGVWVNDRKLASIGVHTREWVTWHGFALNVATDLSYFDLIVPCGIQGVTMTSLAREKSDDPPELASAAAAVVTAFAEVFGLAPVAIEREQLLSVSAAGPELT